MSTDSTLDAIPSKRKANALQPIANGEVPADKSQWKSLRRDILARSKEVSATRVFGDGANRGAIYRWGLAAAVGAAPDRVAQVLSRFAVDAPAKKKAHASVDIRAAAIEYIDTRSDQDADAITDSAVAVMWSAAMPALSNHLSTKDWWALLSALLEERESQLQRRVSDSPAHLMLGAELGLTLAWRLSALPSCRRLEKSAMTELENWCRHHDESLAVAITSGQSARLVLASLIRCHRIVDRTTKRKFKKHWISICVELASWVAAMTTYSGETAFSSAAPGDLDADLGESGLLAAATAWEPESLAPAVAAALGQSHSGGRLAWEVSLPSAFWNEPDAKIAALLPEWDVRRGRTILDYSKHHPRLELFSGKTCVVDGDWQTMIEVDGAQQQPVGDWSCTCDFTDDDVHYLELEQPWSASLQLQRQILVIRDNRCVLLADSVLPRGESATSEPRRAIRYTSRLPLAQSIKVVPEEQTRDVFLADEKRRALVLPLTASEWRVGPTSAKLFESEDQQLVYSVDGPRALYAPLWFDFQRRRFDRQRTWRRLTVVDDLRIVDDHEAAAFRVQAGSEQWLLYRSLAGQRLRTFLGKHMLADFFAARFYAGEESYEELVTVDDSEE